MGYKQDFRPCQLGLMLAVEPSFSVFYEAGPLQAFCEAVLSPNHRQQWKWPRDGQLKPNEMRMLNGSIKGLVVSCLSEVIFSVSVMRCQSIAGVCRSFEAHWVPDQPPALLSSLVFHYTDAHDPFRGLNMPFRPLQCYMTLDPCGCSDAPSGCRPFGQAGNRLRTNWSCDAGRRLIQQGSEWQHEDHAVHREGHVQDGRGPIHVFVQTQQGCRASGDQCGRPLPRQCQKAAEEPKLPLRDCTCPVTPCTLPSNVFCPTGVCFARLLATGVLVAVAA